MILTRIFTRDTGKRHLTDLANSCKWLAEKRLGDITKTQNLLRGMMDRKLGTVMVTHVLMGHSILKNCDLIEKKEFNNFFLSLRHTVAFLTSVKRERKSVCSRTRTYLANSSKKIG